MRARNVIFGLAILAVVAVPVSSLFYEQKQQDAALLLDRCVKNLADVVGSDLSVGQATVWPYEVAPPAKKDLIATSIRAIDSIPGEIFQPKALVEFRVKSGPVNSALCEFGAKAYRSSMPVSVHLMEIVTTAPEAKGSVYKPRGEMASEIRMDRSVEKFLLIYRAMTSKITVL